MKESKKYKSLDTASKDIKKLVKQANKTNNIEVLLDIGYESSIWIMWLFEQEANAKKAYLEAYNERKYKEAMFVLQSDLGATKAVYDAVLKAKEFRDIETANECLYEMIRGLRTSLQGVSETITQKISFLKKEWEFNQFKK